MDYISASRIIRGAQASLSIISAEHVLKLPLPPMYKHKQHRLSGKQPRIFLDLAWEENVYDIPD